MPTMADVARRAGVALSTVSYALNGTRPISQETRERIEQAMQEIGYRPNALARGLATRRSRILAVLFPTGIRGLGITDLEFVTGAASAASDRGYHLVLWPGVADDATELANLTSQGLVQGVVIMEVRLADERISHLTESGVPFTLIGRTEDPSGIDHADIDFAATMEAALDHLEDLGHRHIAFINHSRDSFEVGYGPTVRMQRAFDDSMRRRGLRPVGSFCEDGVVHGHEALTRLLGEDPRLSAVVVMNERAVPGVLQAAAELGLHVPEDLSLVSVVSSVAVAEMSWPQPTVLSPAASELGRRAADLLIDRLEGSTAEPRGELISCSLVEGGTSAPARDSPR